MKTPEDEAFDEIARKQGMWGGGFMAKKAMAADKLHWSDCAVHNGPAYPAGECDCGAAQEQQKKEHVTDGTPCWCEPDVVYVDPVTNVAVIVHREPQ